MTSTSLLRISRIFLFGFMRDKSNYSDLQICLTETAGESAVMHPCLSPWDDGSHGRDDEAHGDGIYRSTGYPELRYVNSGIYPCIFISRLPEYESGNMSFLSFPSFVYLSFMS